METTTTAGPQIDVARMAHQLEISADSLRNTLELLEDGNTVPFITRYRKDRTGGLDEAAIVRIKETVEKQKLLLQRMETILKSIRSQGKLTDELERAVRSAESVKRLEDLYLPYRPKKRTLATLARQRGLEPFAHEVLHASPAAASLEQRASELVNPDHQLESAADVLAGASHILAERFSERADVRGKLREFMCRSGRLCARRYVVPEGASASDAEPEEMEVPGPANPGDDPQAPQSSQSHAELREGAGEAQQTVSVNGSPAQLVADSAAAGQPQAAVRQEPLSGSEAPLSEQISSARRRREQRKANRERKRRRLEQAFKDYFQYEEALVHIPHHRVLAINRGERTRVLRVKLEADFGAMYREAEELLIPTDHPHRQFLHDCLRDAMHRLLIPSLEREIRRELTQAAEEHAISVFAQNLRKLLLQPPVRGRRVLALDPGFRNGCKLAVLDEFGNIIDHAVIFVVGTPERRSESRICLVNLIDKHRISVVAIGNGSGCRESEQLVAEIIEGEFRGKDLSYLIVNEAGASVYSTSDLAREELPGYDATLRGAISIGRRLLDPLSELVKINPSNIGVGLYQHDVKSKTLQQSLDAVVQSCVNYVGVDVNTASPALLSYVSGLNQLTARRIYEYRCGNGPLHSRQQLKQIPGIGEATFVQAAGFLKITGGDNPLDATWIHPESYAFAQNVLKHIGSDLSELARRLPPPAAPRLQPSHQPPAETPVAQTERHESCTPAPEAGPQAPADISQLHALPDPADNPSSPCPASVTQTEEPPVSTSAAPPDSALGEEPPEETQAQPTSGAEGSDQTAPEGTSLAERIRAVDTESLSHVLGIGQLLLQDILSSLMRPGRDPRDDLPPPVFRRGILKLEDLQPGMELSGTVLNVVDFGAFVDIGLSEAGLVHISRLADRFIRDPHEVVGVGDVLSLWVVSVDKQRRRISLTAIKPGTEKPRKPRDSEQQAHGKLREDRKSAGSRRRHQHAHVAKDQQYGRNKRSRGSRPPRKPKPVAPITKAMEEGKEPMRTFSDLKQYYEKKVIAPSTDNNAPDE